MNCNKRKTKDNGGFTLVELIVVLVILAILAALLVPALTGYIDKANQKKVLAEARMTLMAAQTVWSEAYADEGGNKDKLTGTSKFTLYADDITMDKKGFPQKDIIELAELKGNQGFKEALITYDQGTLKVTELIYQTKKYTATYTIQPPKGWTVVKNK